VAQSRGLFLFKQASVDFDLQDEGRYFNSKPWVAAGPQFQLEMDLPPSLVDACGESPCSGASNMAQRVEIAALRRVVLSERAGVFMGAMTPF
jgi:hypothetical protein